MTEYETRKIRGWRGRLDDEAQSMRRRFWNAAATTAYKRGVEAPRSDDVIGKPRWFDRVFGPDRQAASDELRRLRKVKQKIQRSERTSEQCEMDRKRDHERYLLRRANQSAEDRQRQNDRVRARRALHSEAERDHERAMCRKWRARQDSDWRAKEAEKKQLRRLAKPDLYRAIDLRSKEKRRDAINARNLARAALVTSSDHQLK